MDIALFRANFPEFADNVRYPNSIIVYWSTLGEKLISSDRYGDLYTNAVELFTAHNITIAIGNVRASASGGAPGAAAGLVQSKAVGSVSISYDNASVMLPDAGHWGQTIYGRQYIQLARLIGTGCYQL